jgi:hypothetical protein
VACPFAPVVKSLGHVQLLDVLTNGCSSCSAVRCAHEWNKGTGVLESLLRAAFGSKYVATINSEVLLMARGGGEEAKRLSRLLKVARARVMFAKSFEWTQA